MLDQTSNSFQVCNQSLPSALAEQHGFTTAHEFKEHWNMKLRAVETLHSLCGATFDHLALHAACSTGSVNIVKYFLDQRSILDERKFELVNLAGEDDGQTMLHKLCGFMSEWMTNRTELGTFEKVTIPHRA